MQLPRAAVFAAIMRKDFLLVWPMILAALISPAWSLAMTTQWWVRLPVVLQMVPIALGALVAGILALNTFHQDTPASLTHDWLTRPVGPATIITSKVIFLILVLFLPTFAGHIVEHIIKNHSPGEIVMSSLASTMIPVGWVLALGLLGLVTVSIKQASSWGYGIAAGAIALAIIQALFPSDGGAGWLTQPLFVILGGALAAVVLWLVFYRRRPLAARIVYVIGSAVLFLLLALFPAEPRLALQRALSADPAAATPVQVALRGICTTQVKAPETADSVLLVADSGVTAQPTGSMILVDRTRARYVTPDGAATPRLKSDGQKNTWNSRWKIDPGAYEKMASQGATLRLDYDLAILELAAPATEVVVGSGRRYIPQLGYCSVYNKIGRRNVVECFKPFAHSAGIRVEVVGRPDAQCNGCSNADYMPGIFHGAGARRSVSIAVPGEPMLNLTGYTVRLTPMKVQAHFRRSASTPLVPPGQVPICGSQSESANTPTSSGAVTVQVRTN